MRTTIELSDDDAIALHATSVTASAARFLSARLGVAVAAGGVVTGSIEDRDIRSGGTLAVSVAYLPVFEKRSRPFVGISATIATALIRGTTNTDEARTWTAFDLRGGVMIGKTFAGRLVPYTAARVFGGPVYWARDGRDVTGTDRYHVTAGVGLRVRLPARFELGAEVMPLGEQSATASVTTRF